MAALIIGIAVMAVMMTVVMPVWKQMIQREKEEELVFRGEQIAHSIGMFQRKFANAYPPTLDVLVEQKFLRKKYKDPITNEDFVPLTQAQGQAATPGGQATPGRGQQPTPPAAGGRGANPFAGAATPGAAVGGIIGVTSKSTSVSIRLYKGRSHYNEWAFVYTPPATGGTAAPGAPGAPGGRGNNPGQRGNGPFSPGGPFSPTGPGGRGGGRPGGPGAPGGPGGRPGGPGAPGGPGTPFPTGPGGRR
jgi:type II secretory pathway pseudopilin PulG